LSLRHDYVAPTPIFRSLVLISCQYYVQFVAQFMAASETGPTRHSLVVSSQCHKKWKNVTNKTVQYQKPKDVGIFKFKTLRIQNVPDAKTAQWIMISQCLEL